MLLIDIVSLKAIYWKQDALKLVECVCKCFFALNRFEDVGSKTFIVPSSVVSVELSCPRLPSSSPGNGVFAQLPEAKRRSTLRPSWARSPLRSFCSQKGPRWTPRTIGARGLKGRARNPISKLGRFGRFSGLEILRKDVHFQ